MKEENFRLIINDLHKRIFNLEQKFRKLELKQNE